MSAQTQYVIVYAILAVIIVGVVISLLRKHPEEQGPCAGCGLARGCRKKELYDSKHQRPASCGDCPQTDNCEKKNMSNKC